MVKNNYDIRYDEKLYIQNIRNIITIREKTARILREYNG